MVSIGSSTYSKRLLHLVSWSHWFTFFNIIAAILLSSFYLLNETSPETILGKIYLITTWASHMGFLTFIGFVLLIFPLTLIYPKTRFIRGSASFVFTVGLLLLLLDAFIYARLGYHLNASSSDQIFALIQTQIEQNSRAFWFISLVLFFAILAFELVVSNYAWKHLRELQKKTFAKVIVGGLVISFFFSHLTHIWADANLEYDILRQDTVLPLSYPATAKTLLTKYGLFDQQDYIARKTSPLSFGNQLPNYPLLNNQCPLRSSIKNRAIVVLNRNTVTSKQIEQFSQRSNSPQLKLNKHIDNALPNNSWFNLLFSLPSIYKEPILKAQNVPVLFQAMSDNNIPSSLSVFGENSSHTTVELSSLFTTVNDLKDISSFVIGDTFTSAEKGLHIYYFDSANPYQFELFVDALLLSQRQQETKDIIWISSLGNESIENGLSIKPAIMINATGNDQNVNYLTSHMDVVPTLMANWLQCSIPKHIYSVGVDINNLNYDRVIANTVSDGIMVFSKDKSLLVDQNGNFQSYSSQLKAPITVSKDFPLMIDGVNFIRQFTQENPTEQ